MNSPPMRDATKPLDDDEHHRSRQRPSRGRGSRRRAAARRRGAPPHEAVLMLGDAAGHQQRDGGRHEGHRQERRAGQHHQHGHRHRREHLAFDAGEREDRQIDDGDDQHAEQARPDDLARACEDGLEALRRASAGGRAGAAPRPARRRQFSTMMTAPSMMMPKSIAPRLIRLALTLYSTMPVMVNSIDSGMMQAVAIAARMLPSNRNRIDDDEQRAFEQVLLDGRDRGLDQRGAVVDRARHDALRQRARDVLELGGDALRHRAAVLADQQHGGADHGLLAVERRRAGAQLLALAHLGDVADADRHAAARADHDVADFVDVRDLSGRADQILLAVAFDVAGADIGVVARPAPSSRRGRTACRPSAAPDRAARGIASRSRRSS